MSSVTNAIYRARGSAMPSMQVGVERGGLSSARSVKSREGNVHPELGGNLSTQTPDSKAILD
jgi:hypothetical protein